MTEKLRRNRTKRIALLGGLIVIGLGLGSLFGRFFAHTHTADIRVFFSHLEVAFSTLNLVLLAALVVVYVRLYWKTRSRFTAGLLVFVLAFLANVVTSNPVLQELQGYHSMDLGPYAFLPDLFASVAFSFLLYISWE